MIVYLKSFSFRNVAITLPCTGLIHYTLRTTPRMPIITSLLHINIEGEDGDVHGAEFAGFA